ncbi:MAG: LysE family translocator [Pseudomonadota bacterium]
MDIDVWLTFCLAATALLAVPGPVVMLLFGYCLAGGKKAASAAIPGVVLGDLVAMTLSLLGAGALLQSSAVLFMVLKYAGAAYLIWLGFRLFKSGNETKTPFTMPEATSRKKIMLSAFLVTALNPKDIIFFVAFLPQFVDPTQVLVPQFLVLEATFAALVLCSTAVWVFLADNAMNRLSNQRNQRLIATCGAAWLAGAGAFTAVNI